MQLSFVRWEDHNEDGVVEVVTWDKNNIKEDGKRIVGRHMEDRGCWFKVDMVDSRVFWEQDIALLGMIERRLYSKPYFTCALLGMILGFYFYFFTKFFNYVNGFFFFFCDLYILWNLLRGLVLACNNWQPTTQTSESHCIWRITSTMKAK